MAQPERPNGGGTDGPRLPDTLGVGNLIWASPADLMRDNPAALVVNTESYNRISASFNVDQFDPPQVVKVRTYTSEGQEEIRLFVVDGHTRTKFASDNPNVIVDSFRFLQIPVRDVTVGQLRSPIIVPAGERERSQAALTMVQYLRAVIPPTIEHSQIAPERIAAHIIKGWRSMVGEDIAARFSAISALSLLEGSRVQIATDALLNQSLRSQREIMAGETTQERARLNKALLEMASIVRQTRLFKERIAEAAFMLVASGSQVIGGERESLRQIYGILHTPAVETRLEDLSIGEREQTRAELAQSLITAFKKFAGHGDKERIVSTLVQSIGDRNLTLDQVRGILSADTPQQKYDEFRQAKNLERVKGAYQRTQGAEEISDKELTLLDNLARKTHLEDRDVAPIVRVVTSGKEAVDSIDTNRAQIRTTRADLLSRGVDAPTIIGALNELDVLEARLLKSDSVQDVSRVTREAIGTIARIKATFDKEIAIHRTTSIINEVYGEKLGNGFGPQIRANIVTYILREVDPKNEAAVRQRINQLNGLDDDLQARVVNGDIRISAAQRMQEDRKNEAERAARRAATQQVTPAAPPQQTLPRATEPENRTVVPTSRPTIDVTALSQEPSVIPSSHNAGIRHITPAAPIETPATRQASEDRRKNLNNETLRQAVGSIRNTLRDIDLETADLTGETKQTLDAMLNEIGRLRFAHPDIVRVLEQDYPRLLRASARTIENTVLQEEENTSREKRTGI